MKSAQDSSFNSLAKAFLGSTSQALDHWINSVISTLLLDDSQLYIHDWGLLSLFPICLWVKPAFSLISRRNPGNALYLILCCDLVAMTQY